MKTSFGLFAAVLAFAFADTIHAGDFVSQVVQGTTPPATAFTIQVPGDRFLVIRNFTQDAFATDGVTPATLRGKVSVTFPSAATVITASLLNTDASKTLEPVNDVVIAGPATVTVTAGDTNCFITYRKGQD
jgi:hypothetical protein